jgi:uncharacterized protein YndB with AHSA1/START domain
MNVKKSQFIYAIYIRTTAEKLWEALTKPEITRQYFFETTQECTWQVGAPWKMVLKDGGLADSGEVLEVEAPRKLVLRWRAEKRPEAKAEGDSRMTYTVEDKDGCVKLTVTHEIEREESKLIAGVSNGWPIILSSLKSLIETGEALAESRD